MPRTACKRMPLQEARSSKSLVRAPGVNKQ